MHSAHSIVIWVSIYVSGLTSIVLRFLDGFSLEPSNWSGKYMVRFNWSKKHSLVLDDFLNRF